MLFQALLLGSFAAASGINPDSSPAVKNLVVFGDSYSDEGRLQYFQSTGGVPPPPGTLIPTSNSTPGGGYSWPHYVSQALGATTYNYAVSGAVCSNEIVYRYLDDIKGPFPSVIDYEVPAFKADVKYASANPKSTFLRNRTADNTVYVLWDGGNDLGVGGFLLDKQLPGKIITDYIECLWSAFDGLYSTGGRRFALWTQGPFDKSPLYTAIQHGGSGNVNYWPNKTAYNTPEYEEKILEFVTTVNTVYDYGVPFQLLVKKRWPGASFIMLDAHQILLDIYNSPQKYLTAPANVTGFYHTCPDPNSSNGCVNSPHPLSSFLWYDSLHPSERADEIIAGEFVKALEGNSSYATYYS
ncbi:carbohydrate esterase family 16 protein [Xylaria scruposa]|nr:carbohydrate esterase family 16 protein [Xylaria scruposa]